MCLTPGVRDALTRARKDRAGPRRSPVTRRGDDRRSRRCRYVLPGVSSARDVLMGPRGAGHLEYGLVPAPCNTHGAGKSNDDCLPTHIPDGGIEPLFGYWIPSQCDEIK